MTAKLTVKAFFLATNRGKLLVHKVVSTPKGHMIRPPGGHVEYGERTADTIKREMQEELRTGIKNLIFPGVMENLFRYAGKLYHEIDFVYGGELSRKEIYSNRTTEIVDNGKRFNAFWVPIKDIRSGKETLVPGGIAKFINKVS